MFVYYVFFYLTLSFSVIVQVHSTNAPTRIQRKADESSNIDNDAVPKAKEELQEEELEFYKFVNRIDAKSLKVLEAALESKAEEGYVPQTPSPYCCYNGGTCHVPTLNSEDRWCTCFSNFTGRYCDIDEDECQLPNICEENEVCENTYGSYKCFCDDGFVEEEHKCIRKTSCLDDPCLNFGDCIDKEEGRILCVCRLGYSGRRCKNRIAECEDSSCRDEDICVATPDGFQCVKI